MSKKHTRAEKVTNVIVGLDRAAAPAPDSAPAIIATPEPTAENPVETPAENPVETPAGPAAGLARFRFLLLNDFIGRIEGEIDAPDIDQAREAVYRGLTWGLTLGKVQ